ncbi:enoyl-CoA hydratase/isomerase family protein [Glaciecola sp. KUL10]|uniref:enoyl-CoA hydratase/isomerase family protein n=1 Tax=Glaciecola sp. (strain KUL10) TaxID=2161813 RepID=UPI000D782607|nr:enoyl-CoA hydratase/isomerase family protein [Glaciecola sp. KUL10]GBL02740.1 enoyl-CoA hydratase/carnithine racemase [Glaciecola sp. KUL10]
MAVVNVEKLETKHAGKYLACLTLNRPESLNALNLEMLKIIHSALCEWRTDDSIVAILINSQGDKAFCAGGDVVALYKGMQAIKSEQVKHNTDAANFEFVPKEIDDFFVYEYQTDYMIHTYPKPIIAWGNGYIMGGGMGIYSGADIKIATEKTKMAMPEVSIGLFPDVGASYFLNQLPKGVGMFMGLTGVQLNARDAHCATMCTHIIDAAKQAEFKARLLTCEQFTTRSLNDLASEFMDESTEWQGLQSHLGALSAYQSLYDEQDVKKLDSKFNELFESKLDSAWHCKAKNSYTSASPTAIAITHRQLIQGSELSLAECFEQETNMVFQSLFNGEFCEGVRALLIDKDKSPRWHFDSPESVPKEVIDSFFSFFKDQTHPLFSLAEDFN